MESHTRDKKFQIKEGGAPTETEDWGHQGSRGWESPAKPLSLEPPAASRAHIWVLVTPDQGLDSRFQNHM